MRIRRESARGRQDKTSLGNSKYAQNDHKGADPHKKLSFWGRSPAKSCVRARNRFRIIFLAVLPVPTVVSSRNYAHLYGELDRSQIYLEGHGPGERRPSPALAYRIS